MINYKMINNVTGWLVFFAATLVYIFTIEASVSFWDCGEFISAAYKLQVVHPPGAPMFLLIARIFTMFAGGPENVAYSVNVLSALSSSFSILFLFWTITAIAKKIMVKEKQEPDSSNVIAVMGAGIVGAMACTFADSFWFSAVEGEVYALSSFFTALVVWSIFKWENVADKPGSNRWIIFIAFMMGVSIGVHLLNLLAIPTLVFVYYFKKYKTNKLGMIFAGVISIFILGLVQFGIIPGIPKMLAGSELFFVNTLGLPFTSGIWFLIAMLFIAIVSVVFITHSLKDKIDSFIRENILSVFSNKFQFSSKNINTIALCLGMFLFGYTSYFMVVIRSSANPAIDMNDPEDPFNLLSYLLREQYGESPLIYGQYYTAEQEDKIEVGDKYYQDVEVDKETGESKDVYRFKAKKYKIDYEDEFEGFFPRMWSPQSNHKKTYRSIVQPEYEVRDRRSGRVVRTFKNVLNKKTGKLTSGAKLAREFIKTKGQQAGAYRVVDKFDFIDNLKFFFIYQVGWMYNRYFLWNFSGRQNDLQGHMSDKNGNWLSGIDFIDEFRGLIPNEKLPKTYRENKAHNNFYMLPFILGLLGLLFHFNKRNDDAFIVFLLFFFTGYAIVLFLNQYPFQPRERDYAYAGSVYAFCIWIGIGVLAVYDIIRQFISPKLGSIAATIICFCLVPLIMGFEGWDDHDRSNRHIARDFAKNYLESCEQNAILFTQGDNDTYPLWYAQEVEGIRTDIRIVNLSLLAVDWYINYLKRKINDNPGADPIPFSMSSDKYRGDNRDVVLFDPRKFDQKKWFDLKAIMKFIISDDQKTKYRPYRSEDEYNTFPSRRFKLEIDKQKLLEHNVLDSNEIKKMDTVMRWKLKKKMIYKNDLMVLDLIANTIGENNWSRPIYFAVSVSPDAYAGLEKYFRLEGLAYRVVPISSKDNSGYFGYVDTDKMYNNLMNDFRFGGIESEEDMFLDEGVMRMVMNLRIQYARLAEALFKEGKKDLCLNVINKSLESMPEKIAPYNMVMIQYVDLLYRLKETEKAKQLSEKMLEVYEEELEFYLMVDNDYPENLREYKQDFQQAVVSVQRLMEYANKNNEKEYALEIQNRNQQTLMDLQPLTQKLFK